MKNVIRIGVLCSVFALAGCGGKAPEDLGASQGQLGVCPESPNCVSSSATDADHLIAALAIEGDADAAWRGLNEWHTERDDVEIVTSTGDYLHVVYTSSIMRYQDDVEFLLSADGGEIAVRSASRVGYGDMGVNRDRIETIRSALADRGLLRPAAME